MSKDISPCSQGCDYISTQASLSKHFLIIQYFMLNLQSLPSGTKKVADLPCLLHAYRSVCL